MYGQSLNIKIHVIINKQAEDKYGENTTEEVIHKESKEDRMGTVLNSILENAFFPG